MSKIGMLVELLLALGVLTTGLAAPPARRSVVLTTDCGVEVDDQWALAHLALSPELDLKGIVTTHAPDLEPPAAEATARAARDLLNRLPIESRPPVVAGSSRPLADGAKPMANPGIDLLIERSRGHSADDRLIVLVIGAATDVASALLIDPALADRIAVVAMGFNAWPGGTDPWNVKNDVKAWQVLLRSRAPIVVGDAAVTRRHLLMTREKARALLREHGEAGGHLAGLVVDWLDRNGDLAKSETGTADAWPIWDEVVVAHLLGLTATETYRRPTLRDDLTFRHDPAEGTITWVTSIDADRLWDDLVAKLDRASARP